MKANHHSMGSILGAKKGLSGRTLKWPPERGSPGRDGLKKGAPRNGNPGAPKSKIGPGILVAN